MCNMTRNKLFNQTWDCDPDHKQILVDTNISTPDGLAVDWIHGLLFWTDTGLDQVSTLEQGAKTGEVHPPARHSITLYPSHPPQPRWRTPPARGSALRIPLLEVENPTSPSAPG